MGNYLNPGKEAFEESVRSAVFVDKTEMLLYLNRAVCTDQKYVCISRPRRFGKTMAARMLCAYYDRKAESRELFKRLLVSKVQQKTGDLPWDC